MFSRKTLGKRFGKETVEFFFRTTSSRENKVFKNCRPPPMVQMKLFNRNELEKIEKNTNNGFPN